MSSPREFNSDVAYGIIKAAVARKIGLFAAYPDLTREDLVAHCMEKLLESYNRGGYKPERGAFSTWTTRVVLGDLLDLSKVRGREFYRRLGAAKPGFVDGEVTIDEPVSLAEWCKNVRRLAEANVRRHMRGVSPASAGPVAAVLALVRWRRWTSAEAVAFLAENPDVLAALGLQRVPDVSFLEVMGSKGLRFWFSAGAGKAA